MPRSLMLNEKYITWIEIAMNCQTYEIFIKILLNNWNLFDYSCNFIMLNVSRGWPWSKLSFWIQTIFARMRGLERVRRGLFSVFLLCTYENLTSLKNPVGVNSRPPSPRPRSAVKDTNVHIYTCMYIYVISKPFRIDYYKISYKNEYIFVVLLLF